MHFVSLVREPATESPKIPLLAWFDRVGDANVDADTHGHHPCAVTPARS